MIQDNIIFYQKFNAKRYVKTVKACQLERDLDILPASNMTKIGEAP